MTRPVRTLEERLWPKINKTETCWLWLAGLNGWGYGAFSMFVGGSWRPRSAHRVVYELLVGPIPAKYDIDHLCRVRRCVNPAHLEAVTRSENLRRGIGFPALQSAQTHCKRGHILDDAYVWHGMRHCRPCRKEYAQQYHQDRKKKV